MALRIEDGSPRERSLRAFHAAGKRGISRLLASDGPLFEEHQLVEPFTDPTRVLSERYRLTELTTRITTFLYSLKGDSDV